jgi:mono/diheme cytochrome c family protein
MSKNATDSTDIKNIQKSVEFVESGEFFLVKYFVGYIQGGFMHSRRWILVLLPLLMIPFLLHAQKKGDAEKGKELFRRCAICHGDSGEGKEAIGKMFGVTMPHLGSKEVQSKDAAALKKIILEGKGKMKAVSLSDREVEDVIAYLRTLKK